ncbi:MAG: alpha-L-arabinofuranosidase C-terminal domain-containing protein [Fimbriimonas sp.]|nr:alpha-L-arabinofuranosidase C-terminal domain-containing protein [Fimbriimonas sp.]
MITLAMLLVVAGATIEIDAGKVVGAANPMVLGGNLIDYQKGGYGDPSQAGTDEGEGIWDPAKRRPVPEMVELARAAGIKIARWPGGCGAHLYEWKRTIGPLADRPNQLFGLPEYLTACAAIGAEPLITVAEYAGTSQDAADLVEYLNAPNDGNHPWAARRAGDGHPGSWNVKWFEYGNESDHGPHRGNDDIGKIRPPFSPEEYGARYLAYRTSMQVIDPRLKLGAVISTGFQALDGWPTRVAKRIGSVMDFAILHSYLPSVGDPAPAPDRLFPDALAGQDQIQEYVDAMKKMLAQSTGHPESGPGSVPIAVTEFNGGFVQDKPVPYRYCLGDALIVSDMLHLWLRPRNGIAFANFWEFANEYWGMVRGYADKGEPLVRRPMYYAAQLFAQNLGTSIVSARVECPGFDALGQLAIGIERHAGPGSTLTLLDSVPITPAWQITPVKSVVQTTDEGVLQVRFNDPGDLNYYHAFVEAPVQAGQTYRLSAWVKTEDLTTTNGACYQIGDSRGWVVTHSASITPYIVGTSGWKKVEVDYTTLPDTTKVQIVARRLGGTGPVSGVAWYKNLSLTRIIPKSRPAVPVLSVTASMSSNRDSLYLVVTNKDLHREIPVKLTIKGFSPKSVHAMSLTGPSAESTNESDAQCVGLHDIPATVDLVRLPPCSITAIRLDGGASHAGNLHP